MRKVGLHDLYLGTRQDAPIPEIPLPPSESPLRSPIGGEILYERGFIAERSSARYCSASFFVIFTISSLISSEYAIIL